MDYAHLDPVMHSFIHFSFNSSWTLNIKLTLQIFPLSGSSEESPSSYKGKHHPAVFSSHTFLQHSFTSGTRPVGFPYIKQLCPMSWVSHSSSPSRLCVLRDSIRSHRLRAQSYKTAHAPTSDTNHKSKLVPVLLSYWLQFGSLSNSSLVLINLLEWHTEL